MPKKEPSQETQSAPVQPSPPSDQHSGNLTKRQIFVLVALSVVLAAGFLFYNLQNLSQKPLFPLLASPFTQLPTQQKFELKKFGSNEEFQQYIEENRSAGYGYGVMDMARNVAVPVMAESAMDSVGQTKATSPMAPQAAGGAPDRISGTNVQVVGIDEPDIVKTNGKHLFLSTEQMWYGRPVPMPMPVMDSRVMTEPAMIAPDFMPMPPQPQPKTEVITAFPPAALAKLSQIDATGQLLLSKNTLVVLGNQNGKSVLTGYNVTQPAAPSQAWQVKLNDNNQLVTARLMDDKLYVITQSYLYDGGQCPIAPLFKTNGELLSIPCTDIYYPDRPLTGVDTTYTTMIIDPSTGAVQKTASLVGSTSSTVVYMSPTSVYLTYRSETDMVSFLYGFLSGNGQGLFPQTVVDKLAKLESYDLSRAAKMAELQNIMESYQRSLNKDDRLKLENELQNRMQDYLEAHARELEQTMIVKLDADSLTAEATGQVPGYLLNQFSLDEYQDHLRVATTFGQSWTQFGRAESASDVYVLDSSLKQKGVVQDLGKGERIYSVRFLGDKGYVVTFKQVDPFYILDLSNPDRPEKTGELKIPGYSSYLHPIGKDRVVGIGKEDNQVKVSLFDVSNARDPREISKYLLDEYWSELLSTHHAFLLDEKHRVFFMPGSKGGYVLSYAGDQITLTKAISQQQVKRALFINDYLYVIGDQGVTVLDEKDWQTVKELSL